MTYHVTNIMQGTHKQKLLELPLFLVKPSELVLQALPTLVSDGSGGPGLRERSECKLCGDEFWMTAAVAGLEDTGVRQVPFTIPAARRLT
jgi:hypothetical protein